MLTVTRMNEIKALAKTKNAKYLTIAATVARDAKTGVDTEIKEMVTVIVNHYNNVTKFEKAIKDNYKKIAKLDKENLAAIENGKEPKFADYDKVESEKTVNKTAYFNSLKSLKETVDYLI